jgi:hypothetical protein
MNRFKQICSTIRTLNNRTSKDTYIKFFKAMAVPGLTYGSEIRTITKEKQEAKTKTAEMQFFRNAEVYTRTKQEIIKLGKKRIFLV